MIATGGFNLPLGADEDADRALRNTPEVTKKRHAIEAENNNNPTKMLLRVLDDLVMHFNEQELNTVSRFRLGLNEVVINIFEPVLSISKAVN